MRLGTKQIWPAKTPRGTRRWALVALALSQASCVPATLVATGAATPPAAIVPVSSAPAIPALAALLPAAADAPLAFAGRTELDRLRSLDCLAQAIYYEAASEIEEGQRAVAQVVLNRVRHPAWPNSVCGVVYQGPMRAGGGCQFTFTCDGSLARRPGGEAWAQARWLAAEALAGGVFAPAGLSTHYHTHAVAPAWAPQLRPTTVIGAHIFYALPGRWGAADAFTAPYSGTEPLPRPSMLLVRSRPIAPALAALLAAPASEDAVRRSVALPSDIPFDSRWSANLPESTVRDEYRQSGQWRADAPAAITGR